MYNVRTIKSEPDYDAALARVDVLWDAEDGTPDGDELDVLVALIERYEDEVYPLELPSPIDAIRFRMDQQGLSNKDLVPMIGSPGRVSEILSGKRALTLPMIRALHEGLGIPAEVLIRQVGGIIPAETATVDWSKFPIAEMAKNGWVKKTKALLEHTEELMLALIERAGGMNSAAMSIYRKSDGSRRNAKADAYALRAWCLHIMATARETELPAYKSGTVDEDFLREVVKLSAKQNGPLEARKFLAKHGIALVTAQHLKKTYLDGAAMLSPEGNPVIGMTLRFDRLDNFWFCLLHELAHVGWHLQRGETEVILDDLEMSGTGDAAQELEADRLAGEALIPQKVWNKHPVAISRRAGDALALAGQLGVSPAVVAGRVRKEADNYHLLRQLIGTGDVRKLFAN